MDGVKALCLDTVCYKQSVGCCSAWRPHSAVFHPENTEEHLEAMSCQFVPRLPRGRHMKDVTAA